MPVLSATAPESTGTSTTRRSRIHNFSAVDSDGQPCCRWCKGSIPPRRRTFCSQECVHEVRCRTDANYVREKLVERDNGICAGCGLDCLRTLRTRVQRSIESGRLPESRRCEKLARKSGHLWQADHIVPVAEGGGECGLDGYRTFCTACHKKATAELIGRLAANRRCRLQVRFWHRKPGHC